MTVSQPRRAGAGMRLGALHGVDWTAAAPRAPTRMAARPAVIAARRSPVRALPERMHVRRPGLRGNWLAAAAHSPGGSDDLAHLLRPGLLWMPQPGRVDPASPHSPGFAMPLAWRAAGWRSPDLNRTDSNRHAAASQHRARSQAFLRVPYDRRSGRCITPPDCRRNSLRRLAGRPMRCQ